MAATTAIRYRYIGQRDSVFSGRPRPQRVICPDLFTNPPIDPMADYVPGVPWWRAMSQLSVPALLASFDTGDGVACILYEVVGAIQSNGAAVSRYRTRWYPIFIQLAYVDWSVDTCLSEAGIVLDERV